MKLLHVSSDVRFLWQGSVLINVTSIFCVGILVSSGIPHEFLFTHPKLWSNHVFSQPKGRGAMPNPTVITTDLEAAFPTDEKVIAFDSRSSALVSMSTVFARVYTLYLIYKYG